MSTLDAALSLLRVAADAAEGKADPAAIARAVVDVGLAFVPVEELREHLEAAAIARAELAADVIRDTRFPVAGGEQGDGT